jgi:hypothetical protein
MEPKPPTEPAPKEEIEVPVSPPSPKTGADEEERPAQAGGERSDFKQIETRLHSIFSDDGEEPGPLPPPPVEPGPPSPPPEPTRDFPIQAPDPQAVEEGPKKEEFQKIESALADIFHEGGDPEPQPSGPLPPMTSLDAFGEQQEDGDEIGAAVGATSDEGGGDGENLPDFVSKVMKTLDNRIEGAQDLADTAEMGPSDEEDDLGPNPISLEGDTDSRPIPRKDLEALKDLFAGDE